MLFIVYKTTEYHWKFEWYFWSTTPIVPMELNDYLDYIVDRPGMYWFVFYLPYLVLCAIAYLWYRAALINLRVGKEMNLHIPLEEDTCKSKALLQRCMYKEQDRIDLMSEEDKVGRKVSRENAEELLLSSHSQACRRKMKTTWNRRC